MISVSDKSEKNIKENRILRPCNICNGDLSREVFIKKGFILAQCISCGLVYVKNPPSKEELRQKYSFESGYHVNSGNNLSVIENHFKIAKYHFEFIKKYKAPGRILDIGCSAGFFLKVAQENKWETLGLEMSRDTAEIAQERYGLDVITGDISDVYFSSNSFDVVTLWDVIEHVENPMNTMHIINRSLKDGGIVALSTPIIDGLFPKLSYKISKIINYWPHPEPPGHLFQFSKETICKLFARSGFEVIEMHDERIPIHYSFGSFKSIVRSLKQLFYATFFISIAVIGPLIHKGDSIIVIAKKTNAIDR